MNKEALYKIYKGFIKRRFLLTFVIFIVWTALIDSNSWLNRLQYEQTLDKLKTEKLFYEKKIKEDSIYLNELKTNNANLEKFAREKHLMKKENEDLFVIVPKKTEQ